MTLLCSSAPTRPRLVPLTPSPVSGGGLGWGRADEVIE
jgi:hypothetical protein